VEAFIAFTRIAGVPARNEREARKGLKEKIKNPHPCGAVRAGTPAIPVNEMNDFTEHSSWFLSASIRG
jgi:hypothetical protein